MAETLRNQAPRRSSLRLLTPTASPGPEPAMPPSWLEPEPASAAWLPHLLRHLPGPRSSFSVGQRSQLPRPPPQNGARKSKRT